VSIATSEIGYDKYPRNRMLGPTICMTK